MVHELVFMTDLYTDDEKKYVQCDDITLNTTILFVESGWAVAPVVAPNLNCNSTALVGDQWCDPK